MTFELFLVKNFRVFKLLGLGGIALAAVLRFEVRQPDVERVVVRIKQLGSDGCVGLRFYIASGLTAPELRHHVILYHYQVFINLII